MQVPLRTKLQVEAHRKLCEESFEAQQTFSYPRKFTALADNQQTFEIPIGNGSDFQILGYNIEYDKRSDDAEVLFLQFSQQIGNRKWSSDYEPIASIATPGVRNASNPPSRYGYRQFPGFAPQNDKIKIDVLNQGDENLEVVVTVIGVLLRR